MKEKSVEKGNGVSVGFKPSPLSNKSKEHTFLLEDPNNDNGISFT